ncbi:grasp-with-spasm system ATP-grasp peptide maturase [Crocinitomix algicola]|uniref:grasp-with-spasm system ATP-grasp peptide maturase n=1 Tax=Crocinitomix algicola TaxID=1740263 RepID=UPI00082B0C30|nr:grasp-with-spasm system ATP-grasp peptide maturase [Crocinitomix algicola]
MVIIISSDFDESTDKVMKWLLRFKKDIIRTGNFNYLSGITISNEESKFKIFLELSSGISFDLDKVESFWYRKARLKMFENLTLTLPNDLAQINEEYKEYILGEELQSLETFLLRTLEKKAHIGNYFEKNGNKLFYFQEAISAKMNVPQFIVSTDTKKLSKKLLNGSKMIKPLQDLFYSINEKETIKNYYSVEFNMNELSLFAKETFPSMLQNYVDKKFEIRTFFLKGELYSMAIFSQNDEKTKIDFRNYNDNHPNRMIPYQMPDHMKYKICSFMKSINLNTGSLDFIMTKQEEYVFLEVNPAGQYGMVEANCFYSLDEKIANYLNKYND